MPRGYVVLVLCALGVAVRPVPALAVAARVDSLMSVAAGRCGVCHPGERVEFLKSTHASEGVTCTACHGGNASASDERAAHSGDFRRTLPRADVPRLCASCHSDEERMRPYDLPVDQYALYQTSTHGKKLAKGDTRVAVCSDCHGAHAILPPSDPASRVFVRNIPQTCGTCHATAGTGPEKGPHAKALAEYRSSVHAAELYQNDNDRAPTCVSCHGVHGAAPQNVGDIGKVCGQCHVQERRALLSGPHAVALARAGLPECASCHGAHAVRAAAPRNLSIVCNRCHTDDPAIQRVGRDMWAAYDSASAQLDRAERMVERADRIPINTDDYKASLVQARTYLGEALPAAHSVQLQSVTDLTMRAQSIGVDVETEVRDRLGHLSIRRYGLVVFWFYVVLTLVILRQFRKARRTGV